MMHEERKQTRSRSIRIKKYEVVYEKYIAGIKNNDFNSGKTPKVKKIQSKKKKAATSVLEYNKISKPGKRKSTISLNAYQKFVRVESKKNKYKSISLARERMIAIGKAWRKSKK